MTTPRIRKPFAARKPSGVRAKTARARALRGWADFLRLAAVCDNASCRRAGTCRGAIQSCAPQNFARLPEGVQGLACCLWDAKAKGLSFEAALSGFAGSPAEAAWNAWCATQAPA